MRRALLTLLGLSVATAAGAHHSPALYDLQKTITLAGSVVKYQWSNPHVYIFIRSASDAGDSPWEIETGSPTMMERAGWLKESLRVAASSLTGNWLPTTSAFVRFIGSPLGMAAYRSARVRDFGGDVPSDS